jgi:hypothetical protein
MTRFRALYGAGPLNLLALLASFAIAGAAVVGWFQRPRDVVSVLVWFAAAIVLHDLVLLPLYSLLDRIAFGVAGKRLRGARRPDVSGLVNPTPYLRIPAILSGLLLAVFFPVIGGFGAQTELSASGIPESGYLARWLLATGVIFAASAIAYALAIARAGGPPATAGPPPGTAGPPPGTAGPPATPDPGPDQVLVDPRPAAPDQDQAAPSDGAAPTPTPD